MIGFGMLRAYHPFSVLSKGSEKKGLFFDVVYMQKML